MWAYLGLASLQVANGYQQGDIIKQNGDLQQSIDDMNANFQNIDAWNAQKAGYSKGAQYQDVVDKTIATQRANYAGASVNVDYGSAADTQADSKIAGMMNVMQLQRQGREQALGYNIEAVNTRLGGTMASAQAGINASAAEDAGIMGAVSTGVSGYERSNVTGTGTTSRSGTNSSPQWKQDASAGAATGQGPSWFFGDGPSRFSQPSMGSQFSGGSSDKSLFSESNWSM